MSATAQAAQDMLHIPCPDCQAVVRVPRDRVHQQPKCPKCKSAVLDGRVLALDSRSFETQVGRSDLPVLVDFWAPWCAPCRAMAPVLERAAAQWATRLRVAKLDTDREQALAGRFGIRSIPTLILFRGGREVARHSGAVDLGTLGRWAEEALGG